jgi:phosphate acetyltransferase
LITSISKKSAAIKGIKNDVAGIADVLLVPSVETGNGLVKMLIYFSGACAAGVVVGGKVPVVITSRSDEAQARLSVYCSSCSSFRLIEDQLIILAYIC